MTRWRASGIHLSICGLIGLLVMTVMLGLWYPSPYFDSMGGKELLIILLAVDLTLGPLLTLIIFNPKKKSLKFDLSVIGAFQLAALAYGLSVLYDARPVYLVFTVDRFEVVSANEISQDHLKKANSAYQSLPVTGPKLVTAQLPDDPLLREQIMFSALQGGPDIQAMPEYFQDYSQHAHAVVARARPLSTIQPNNPELERQLQLLVKDMDLEQSDVSILPVRAKQKFVTALVDPKTADVIKLVDVDPYLL